MATLKVLAEEGLYRFLEEHTDSHLQRELLLFWGMHPNARFNTLAIRCAVGCNKLDLEGALRSLVEQGLLDIYNHNGLSLYSLTAGEEKRRSVMGLATLGWDRWQLILRRVERRDR